MLRRPMCLLCLFLITAVCLAEGLGISLIRGNPLPKPLRKWVQQQSQVTIRGEVVKSEDTQYSQSVYLKHVYLIYNSKQYPIEEVRIFLKEKAPLRAGALVVVCGKLEEVKAPRNPGEFDSRQYYACQHIYYFMKNAVLQNMSPGYGGVRQKLLELRQRLASVIKVAAGTEAGIFTAIVLGDKRELDAEVQMRYQLAGIVHMLAISGLHISILGMGLFGMCKYTGMGILPAAFLTLTVMLLYGIMTGGSVSTMRAVTMFLLNMGAKMLGRIYDMPTALALTAVLLLLESPAYLFQSSFLLSFGAVLGVGVVAPVIQRTLAVKRSGWKLLLSSACVQATTLPVVLCFFGEVSIAGIFLNLAVLPTVGVVLASGAAGVLGGLFYPPLGRALILPGRILLKGYEWLCMLAAKLPFCTWIGGQPKVWQTAVYYVLFGIALLVLWRDGKKRAERKQKERAAQYRTAGALGAVLLGMVILGWQPKKDFRLTFLDVGQGDCIVAETESGRYFLIDGGSQNKKQLARYQILPYLRSRGISYLDGIFVSHTDEDHISGIRELLAYMGEGLTTIRAGTLILPDWEETPEAYIELCRLAEKAGVQVLRASAGDVFQSGSLKLQVHWPKEDAKGENVNEEALVLELVYRGLRCLFTGDIGEATEQKLLKEGCLEEVKVLKVGHHGSRFSTGEDLLQKIKPKICVISASDSNTYGHPNPETLKRLENAGARVWCTKDSGAVTLTTEGEYISVQEFAGKSGEP